MVLTSSSVWTKEISVLWTYFVQTGLIFVFTAFLLIWIWGKRKGRKNFPPGPMGVPILGYLPFLGKTPHKKYGEIQKKYGSVFSIKFGNYPVVILNDFPAIKDALTRSDYHGRPDLLPLLARGEGEKVGMALNEGREWQEQRRFMLKTLRDLGFGKTQLEPVIKEEIEDFIKHMRSFVGDNKVLPIKRLFNPFVMNSLWRIVTGERTSAEDNKVIGTITEGIIQTEMVGACYFMPWLAKLCPNLSGFNRYLASVPPTRNLMREIIASHKVNFDSSSPRDFIDLYLCQIEKDKDPTSSFYKDRGLTNLTYVLMDLFSAGSETTSAALSWALMYLINSPESMKKIQNEIDSVVGQSRTPSLADRKQMPYTEAVMWETMRKGTISLGFMSKTEVDGKLCGYDLPKGTILLPNLWAVHYDEKYWGDPHNFRPERFLRPDGTFQKDERALAFGIGRRDCPGQSLATLQFFLFLTTILQTFEFQFDPSQPPPSMEPVPGIALTPQPFSLVIKERLSN